jgi:hypothetical protein
VVWRRISPADATASIDMIAATGRSGHADPVPNTPSAASQDRDVPKHVVTRARPDAAHVAVAFPVPKQQPCDHTVRKKCARSNDCHDGHARHPAREDDPGNQRVSPPARRGICGASGIRRGGQLGFTIDEIRDLSALATIPNCLARMPTV